MRRRPWFSDAATGRAEIIHLGLRRNAGDREHASTAKRSNLPPFDVFERSGIRSVGGDCFPAALRGQRQRRSNQESDEGKKMG